MKFGLYIIDILFKILLLLGFVAVILCILSSHISPVTFPIIQYFGLMAPFIVCFNIIISLYWVVRLKPFVIIAIITLILTFFPASKIYRLDIKNDTVENIRVTRVVSYNVMHFANEKHEQKDSEILKQIKSLRPDIACFQEFSTHGINKADDIGKRLNLGYKRILYTQKLNNSTGMGIAVYSKYPIIRYKSIKFEDSNNCAMWVDIKIKRDTIRVFNLHLESSKINKEEREILSDTDILTSFDSEQDIDKISGIIDKFLTSSAVRIAQAETISSMIESSPHRVIVCGDFNDTPNSYTYNVVKGDLRDSFIEAGKGYGYSFKDFFSLYRIDYILYDENMSIYKYKLGESEYSDHHPVIAELIL